MSARPTHCPVFTFLCYFTPDLHSPEEAILAKRVSALSLEQLRNLARRGASAAVAELEAEIHAIRKAFPELGNAANAARAAGRRLGRRRKSMSAAARKAVSARMKKYWAARRAAKAKK